VAERDARPASSFRSVAKLGAGPRKVKGVGARTLATITPALCVGADVDPLVGDLYAPEIGLFTFDGTDEALYRWIAEHPEGFHDDVPFAAFPFDDDGIYSLIKG